MGDRRKGDRRAPEEGVIRIQKKNIWVYGIIIVFLILAIVLNIISWKKYFETKNKYNTVIDNYYNGDSNSNSNTELEKNTKSSNNYTCDISINENKASIKPGESIEYEVKVSNINAVGGIKTFETYIDYDSSKFDCRVENDKNRNWSMTSFLKGYLTMDKSDLEASAEDQVIAKIIFIAKQGIAVGDYEAKLTKIEFISGDNKVFEIADNVINIKVK